jgi:hypothetical protein
MAKEHSGGIVLATGFRVDNPSPLDDRLVVENLSDLTSSSTFPNIYGGILVSVINENYKTYRWNGSDRTNLNNWILIVSSKTIFTNITASGNISSSGDIIGSRIKVGGSIFTSASLASGGVSSYTDLTNVPSGIISSSLQLPDGLISSSLQTLGNITSSGNISASGIIKSNGIISTGILTIPGFPNLSSSLAAAVAGGDNLGNHTAVQNLNLNSNSITNAVNITASGDISSSGTITTNQIVVGGGTFTSASLANAIVSTLFNTGSTGDATPLANLIIKDFSNNVSINVNNGTLELTFGTPSTPTISSINVSGFNTNRFDKVNDTYTLTPQFNLNGTTFVKGMLSSSLVGLTEFDENGSITINPTTFPTYASGSHTFTAKIIARLSDNSLDTIQVNGSVSLNKLNPTPPSINVSNISVTTNAYRNAQNEIEEGATGTITWSLTPGVENEPNGWIPSSPHFNSYNTTLTVNSTGNVTTGTVSQFWNSGNNNSYLAFHTGETSKTWTRVRSLRYGTSRATSFTNSQLQNLNNWISVGTIKYGYNSESEIESLKINFDPPSSGEYLYIVYDSSLPNINIIMNQTSLFNEITAFNSPDIIGNYKVYRTKALKNGTYEHKITFA